MKYIYSAFAISRFNKLENVYKLLSRLGASCEITDIISMSNELHLE